MYQEVANALSQAMEETVSLISLANQKDINKVPFEGGWTAAQTARHLIKAGNGAAAMFTAPAPKANRKPDEKAPELEGILLDFDRKMDAPDFIVPEDRDFTKEELINDTGKNRKETMAALETASLDEVPEMPEGNPLKGYTKLELLYFALYHTQRHNRQIRNILKAV